MRRDEGTVLQSSPEAVRKTTSPVKVRKPGSRGWILENEAREEIVRLVYFLFLRTAQERRTVVFAPVEQGESGWITAHVGLILAHGVSQSICLVDANLRGPSLHSYFGLRNDVGLLDALLEPGSIRDFVQFPSGLDFCLLTSGSPRADGHGLISSARLRERIVELQVEFEYLLINAPSVLPYADATVLGRLADGVVLVVDSQSTRRESAVKARDALDCAGVRLLGAVLQGR